MGNERMYVPTEEDRNTLQEKIEKEKKGDSNSVVNI